MDLLDFYSNHFLTRPLVCYLRRFFSDLPPAAQSRSFRDVRGIHGDRSDHDAH